MADTLIAGTTIVESSSRSNADIPIGGIIEWDDTFTNIPDGFLECDGSTVSDAKSSYDGSILPSLNTNYWSIPGSIFIGAVDDSDKADTRDSGITNTIATGGGGYFVAPVILPHGAIITGVVINGSVSTRTWTLKSHPTDSTGATTMATAVLDTEDTTISNATINNNTNVYWLTVQSMANAEWIHGAKITYTTRFKFIIRVR